MFVMTTITYRKLEKKIKSIITKTCPYNIRVQRFISPAKNENFHENAFDIFLIFAQNIDCGKCPHESMFWSKNRNTPANPIFSI